MGTEGLVINALKMEQIDRNSIFGHQHQFSEDNVSVLSREARWFQRGVAETTHIVAGEPPSTETEAGTPCKPSTPGWSSYVTLVHTMVT